MTGQYSRADPSGMGTGEAAPRTKAQGGIQEDIVLEKQLGSSTFRSTGRETLGQLRLLKFQSPPSGHTVSNKITTTLTRPYLLTPLK